MRLIRLRTKLNEIKEAVSIDLLVFEEAGFSRYGHATRVAAELRGLIQVWCEDNGINWRTYRPGEIKKHATGNGRAGKAAMLEAAKSKLNYQGHDTDTADALWLLALAEHDYAN